MRPYYNQYSDIIPSRYHSEYKKHVNNGDVELAEKLIDDVISKIRSINTFPMNKLEKRDIVDILKRLSLTENILQCDGSIELNNNGIELINNIYPNLYHIKRYEGEQLKPTMYEGFYSDRILRHAVKMNLMYDNTITMFRRNLAMAGCGYTNSFRPTVAKTIYDDLLQKNGKVFDYSSGYGGRLLGAWSSSKVLEYIGIDPNTETLSYSNKLIGMLRGKSLKVFDECSEDFCPSEYREYFDLSFSSPPYFNKEVYSDDGRQSYNRFPDYKIWVIEYLKPTIENSYKMLKHGGYFVINIAETLPNIIKIINRICKDLGLEYVKSYKMLINVRPGMVEGTDTTTLSRREKVKEKSEPILVFRKA